jgi:hypothetical protein
VGASYQAPDVAYLATMWFNSSSGSANYCQGDLIERFYLADDVRQAAKTLFDAGIVRLSDEESIALVDAWQHHRKLIHISSYNSSDAHIVPCLQPSTEKESAKASLALFICGYMAAEKYNLLSTR